MIFWKHTPKHKAVRDLGNGALTCAFVTDVFFTFYRGIVDGVAFNDFYDLRGLQNLS